MINRHSIFENEIGIDGCGDGCFAGPIIYAGILLPKDYNNNLINDSKKITSEKKREKIYEILIKDCLEFQIGIGEVDSINQIGMVKTRQIAINNLLAKFKNNIEYIIMDGGTHCKLDYLYSEFIKGDSKYLSIAAASIIAKVTRDRIMNELHKNENYTKYNWIKNKGYGTNEHRNKLKEFGLSDKHRLEWCKNWI